MSADSLPDMVNHPPHYQGHPAGIECIDVIEHLPTNLGTAIKYIWRVGYGGGKDNADPVEDLGKAVWYISREIERIQGLRRQETRQ
jgi:Protein of unknwon function (DUF3310)